MWRGVLSGCEGLYSGLFRMIVTCIDKKELPDDCNRVGNHQDNDGLLGEDGSTTRLLALVWEFRKVRSLCGFVSNVPCV